MSRNIWLTFEEWSAIKEEVNPEKWWSYHLTAHQLKEWKSDIKNGYGDQKCFNRAGVNTNILNKITTPRLYNRLLQENYRDGDLCNCQMFINEDSSDEWNESCLNNFISWVTTSVEGVDMDTTKEQWIEYNKAMKVEMDSLDKTIFFHSEMIKMFNRVTVKELAHAA
tara:strand:- start:50 stop:550 length:501 start_codon:yes stop_codon:yes gene_type:complete